MSVPNEALDPLRWLAGALEELRARGLERRLRVQVPALAGRTVVDGRDVLNFSSNDYLDLAGDKRVCAAAVAAIDTYGFGAGSARLITGTFPPHQALEDAIAQWKGTEAALLFSSGYHANTGLVPALADIGDVVVSDALNHASIVDGCRLSRAQTVIVPHGDVRAIGEALETARRGGARRALVVTDTVFGMDGTLAPLVEIAAVARAHDATLVVDEAHAGGVLGPGGRGLVAAVGLGAAEVPVQMGTLGKALGGVGAFVAGSRALVSWLLNRARPFVFTTALPAAAAAAALTALRIVTSAEGDERRAHALGLAARFRNGAATLGLRTLGAGTPIVPVAVGDPARAVRACAALLARGLWAQAIRAPTVPAGTERLRFAFTAGHRDADVDFAVEALAALVARGELPTTDAARESAGAPTEAARA